MKWPASEARAVSSTASLHKSGDHDGIELRNVSKSFETRNGKVLALAETSVQIRAGSFVTVIGRSGCGKSTLLRLMAGLMAPTRGTVRVGDENVRGRPPSRARFVFQDFAESLFPWKTVAENVEFGLRHALHGSEAAIDARHYLEQVGLDRVGHRYPHELSGGMQQRLAIARALASGPRFLFMDEPFSAIDALSRGRLQDLALQLWDALKITFVVVTHDIEEAVYLADRVLVLAPNGAGVACDIDVDLPWPRSQLDTKESVAFLEYRRLLMNHVLGTK